MAHKAERLRLLRCRQWTSTRAAKTTLRRPLPPVAGLRPQMNFLMPLFTGLAIQTHGWEQHGRKAKDWRS